MGTMTPRVCSSVLVCYSAPSPSGTQQGLCRHMMRGGLLQRGHFILVARIDRCLHSVRAENNDAGEKSILCEWQPRDTLTDCCHRKCQCWLILFLTFSISYTHLSNFVFIMQKAQQVTDLFESNSTDSSWNELKWSAENTWRLNQSRSESLSNDDDGVKRLAMRLHCEVEALGGIEVSASSWAKFTRNSGVSAGSCTLWLESVFQIKRWLTAN